MQALASELGPAETKIDIQVDTLRYDVGVFALGALGTGVFLFVNSLVGGLLTLAAPILAMVLHERAGSQVKAQAKQRSPEVLARAQEAVQGRFAELVEQFSAQLADFVNTAGEALHRGISEVLDRALADRRARGSDAVAGEKEVASALAALDRIEARLDGLREQLWASSTASSANSAT